MIRQVLGRAKTGLKTALGFGYDALDILRRDHMKVERLAIELRLSKDVDKRRRLLEQLRGVLDRHFRVEEQIIYPACLGLAPLAKLVDHAYTDHQLAKNALKDLAIMDPSFERYDELVTKVIKEVEHHVYEEEKWLFGGIRKHMSRAQVRELTRQVIDEYRGPRPLTRAA